MTLREVRAAGGVVTRTAPDGRLEVLVVHRPRYDDWSLPKGKAEPGESDEATALREVEEETGLRCRLGPEVATVRYVDRRGHPKAVRYWSMTVESDGGLVATAEIDDRRWISVGEATALLTYGADRDIVLGLPHQ